MVYNSEGEKGVAEWVPEGKEWVPEGKEWIPEGNKWGGGCSWKVKNA